MGQTYESVFILPAFEISEVFLFRTLSSKAPFAGVTDIVLLGVLFAARKER